MSTDKEKVTAVQVLRDNVHNLHITEDVERMIAFVSNLRKYDGNVTKACRATKVARKTYYNWIERHNFFREAVEIINEEIIDMVEEAMKKEIIKGNDVLMRYYLNNKARHRGYGLLPSADNESQSAIKQTNVLRIEIVDSPRDKVANETIDIQHTEVKSESKTE